MITFRIGEGTNQKDFQIHKGLLCHHSGFFDAALNGSFAEAGRDVYELPETGIKTFNSVVLWLYTRRLFDASVPLDKISRSLLVLVYAFRDEHLIPGLYNAVIDTWRDIFASSSCLEPNLSSSVYEKTPEGSNLRKWFVFMFSTGMTDFEEMLAEYDNLREVRDVSTYHKEFVWERCPRHVSITRPRTAECHRAARGNGASYCAEQQACREGSNEQQWR